MKFYHGTVDYAAVGILGDRKFIHSDGEKHLLGKGIYLYSDPDHAFVWSILKTKYENRTQKPKEPYKPVLIEVEININDDQFLDFDLRQPQNLFFKQRDNYYAATKREGFQRYYYTDSHYCDFLCNQTSVKMITKTFVYTNDKRVIIPVKYTNQKQTDRNVTRHFHTEKQFCLKDDLWIKNISLVESGEFQ